MKTRKSTLVKLKSAKAKSDNKKSKKPDEVVEQDSGEFENEMIGNLDGVRPMLPPAIIDYVKIVIEKEIAEYKDTLREPISNKMNMSHVLTQLTEFMNNYIILGHDVDGNEIVYDLTPTTQDENAVSCLLKKVFISAHMH